MNEYLNSGSGFIVGIGLGILLVALLTDLGIRRGIVVDKGRIKR